jgi:hypothetical protein
LIEDQSDEVKKREKTSVEGTQKGPVERKACQAGV